MRNNRKIVFISIIVILLIALVVFSMHYIKDRTMINNEIDTGKEDDSKEEYNNQVNEKFFEEYLKVFEYLGDDFKSENDDDLRDFVVFKYIVDREEEFKYINGNEDYDEYIEIPTKDIENLINKYFGRIDYKVKNYEGERFYKIEVNGEKTKIYIKSIGFDRYDIKVENIRKENEDNIIYVTAKFSLLDYDPADEYTAEFEIYVEDGLYRIWEFKLINLIPQEVELKDFAGKYFISLGPDGYENLEITYKNSKLYFDWTYGPFNMTEATYKVKDYKFENNQLTVTKVHNAGDEEFATPVMFIYRDKLFIKQSTEKEDGTYEDYYFEVIKE